MRVLTLTLVCLFASASVCAGFGSDWDDDLRDEESFGFEGRDYDPSEEDSFDFQPQKGYVTRYGLEEFGSPIYGKRRLKERHVYFHENTGRESVLEYDVEHHDEVLHFRQEKFGVVEAKCNHGLMKLKFKSSEGVPLFVDHLVEGKTVLTGGCLNATTLDVEGVALTVVAIGDFGNSTWVELNVRPASWEEVFQHASVSANFQPGFQHEVMEHRRKLGWFGNKEKKIDCSGQNAKTPECNAEYGKEHRLGSGISKSHNGLLFSKGGVNAYCQQCSFNFQPKVRFGLKVSWGGLKKVEVALIGNANAVAKVKLTSSFKYSVSKEKELGRVKVPSIKFSIGVFPVIIDLMGAVSVGVDADVKAKASLITGVIAGVSAEAGMRYNSALSPSFSRIGKFTPTYRVITPQFSGKLDGTKIQVYVRADLTAVVNYVIEGKISPSISATYSKKKKSRGKVQGGLAVHVSGALGVKIRGRNFGPEKVLANKRVFNRVKVLWTSSSMYWDEEFTDDDPEYSPLPSPIYFDDPSNLVVDIPEELRGEDSFVGRMSRKMAYVEGRRLRTEGK